MENSKNSKPLIIVDGFGFIFRAYHVQPPLTSPIGTPVGAIYGFTSMLLKLIADFKPEDAVIVLDHGGKNFRHDIYRDYKSNRPPAPDDLVAQLKLVEQAARALNFECISKLGYEADDIIATLACKATAAKKDVIIISSDKDLMQLLDEYVQMYDPVKAKFIQKSDVVAKFGVEPAKVRDVQALMGDSSDNIPGVSGFGPKIAASLINQFGSLDAVLSSIDQIKNKRQQDLLRTYLDDARVSWQLVGLDQDVNLDHTIDSFKWSSPSVENISKFLAEYGFKSLNKRIENLFNLKIHQPQLFASESIKEKKDIRVSKITSGQEFEQFMALVEREGVVSVSLKKQDANVDFVFGVGDRLYLVTYVCEEQNRQTLFDIDKNHLPNLSFSLQIERLFSDSSIKKIVFNLKELLKLCNFACRSFEDLQLMDYVLNAGKKSRNIHEIINDLVNKQVCNSDELYEISPYLIDCYTKLKSELFQNKLSHLYYDIDLPLCYILNDMEKEGVKIDIQYLKSLSEDFGKKIAELEKKIYQLTGEEFNIASPKQLGKVLFDKMQLPFAKTTGKNKSFVTSADILEKLHEKGFEVAGFLLEWRHLTKLKNTYTDTLPKQVNKDTGRVHTTFLQASTATGRLSSTNPNVQNIPIRTEEGSSIRAAFIANQGKKLISADYSQIELRILSHVANIDSLKKAMSNNRDIHSQTASQIFSTPIDRIDSELRRKAKAINFGIIYGISSFGLAKQLNISKKEASHYIERYFKEYPGIQKYMSDTIEYAKENGYVKNLLGRKCFIPTINDKNHAYRSFGERAAINAPMQSLASDIVKIAMIKLDSELKKRSMQTKMILQIHDELIFEAPECEVDEVIKLIKERMESAICLDVKTDVEVNFGNNWKEIN
jgi:DNA polymerase I